MYICRSSRPDAAIQSPTSAACVVVSGGSINTASCRPVISVEVIGDHIRVLPSGSRPRPDCGICVVTKSSCSSRLMVSPHDRVGEVENRRRDRTGVLDVYPMTALVDDVHVGFDEALADGID